VINSGREAMVLEGIGEATAEKLERKLKEYRETHGETTINDGLCTQKPNQTNTISSLERVPTDTDISLSSEPILKSKPSKKRVYIPAYRSGAYAIIMALLVESQKDYFCGYLTKRELFEKAQQYCDVSFAPVEPGRFHTGWTSMKTLIEKELVIKEGSSNMMRYSLSAEGEILAKKLQFATCQKSSAVLAECERENPSRYSTFSAAEESRANSQDFSTVELAVEEEPPKTSIFQFEYVATEEQMTLHRDQACTKFISRRGLLQTHVFMNATSFQPFFFVVIF
jgi:hypothetical protein